MRRASMAIVAIGALLSSAAFVSLFAAERDSSNSVTQTGIAA